MGNVPGLFFISEGPRKQPQADWQLNYFFLEPYCPLMVHHIQDLLGLQEPGEIASGSLVIDLAGYIVTRSGEEIQLNATEFRLLAYLATNAGGVLTHQAILSHVWEPADADHLEYLRVYIRQLRKKLEVDPEHPRIILNEPGIGCRFVIED